MARLLADLAEAYEFDSVRGDQLDGTGVYFLSGRRRCRDVTAPQDTGISNAFCRRLLTAAFDSAEVAVSQARHTIIRVTLRSASGEVAVVLRFKNLEVNKPAPLSATDGRWTLGEPTRDVTEEALRDFFASSDIGG